MHWDFLMLSDVKGRKTSVKVVKGRPQGFSLTFRTRVRGETLRRVFDVFLTDAHWADELLTVFDVF